MEQTSVFAGERLLEIEAENRLFELKVGDVYLWQYVRYICLTRILEEITGIETTNRQGGFMQCDTGKKCFWEEWIKKQQFLVHSKDILVLNHPRRVKTGNYYKCFVTDTILENLDYSYYVYEQRYNGFHSWPVKTRNLKYVSINDKKMRKYEQQRYSKFLKEFTVRIFQIFEQNCRVTFSKKLKEFLISYIKSTHQNIFYFRIWADRILTLVKPKAVIVTVGYNLLVQVIVAQAKKRKIPTIELEHGRIGETHIAYNYLNKGKIEAFADYMFVYGEYERTIPRYPIGKKNVMAVGYPELEKRAVYYAGKNRSSKRKVITFISGPEDGKIVSKYAINLRKNIRLGKMRMVYKLHPSEYQEWKEWYPDLINSGLEIISNNEHDIYYYIGNSDYVVGISSTVLFEATEFNTRIFVIKEKDYRKSEVLYQWNMAELVTNECELADKILEPHLDVQQVTEKKYFTKDSIQNIRRELKNIMSF